MAEFEITPVLGPISLGLSVDDAGPIVQAPEVAEQRWRFLIGPASGGITDDLTSTQDRKFTARLVEPSDAGFSIDANLPEAAGIDELVTDLHVQFTDDDDVTWYMYRGRIANSSDDGDADADRATFPSVDYRGWIRDARRLLTGDTLTYTGDQGETAWSLLNASQGHVGGNLGISKGWSGITPTGVAADWTFLVGDSIGEQIKKIGETESGFDWDIVPLSESALQFQIWSPQRGVDRGIVLEKGGLVSAYRREVTSGNYRNALRYTGADGLTAQELAAADLATRAEGRMDGVYADGDLQTQAALNARASWQLAQGQLLQPTYTFTLKARAWGGPGHIWLGDPVRAVIYSGRLQVDTTLRVFELAFTIPPEGEETVQVTVGGPRPDYRRKPTLDQIRLTNLERR